MEIIKVRSADYARYEELLLRRDQLRKDANIYHGLYVKEFGELHLGIFEKQIACIRKKKLIGYYQMALNRGEEIDQSRIDALLTLETDPYQYKFILDDPAAVREKRRDLEEQKKEYEDYEKELDSTIEALLKQGVKIIWKM